MIDTAPGLGSKVGVSECFSGRDRMVGVPFMML